MARGKNIGGLDEETKIAFGIRELQGGWKNHNDLMKRMIILYDEYNDQYEKEHPRAP